MDLQDEIKRDISYGYVIPNEKILELIRETEKIISESRDDWFDKGYEEARRKFEDD